MQTLVGADGKEIRLGLPHGDELPPTGFDHGACGQGLRVVSAPEPTNMNLLLQHHVPKRSH